MDSKSFRSIARERRSPKKEGCVKGSGSDCRAKEKGDGPWTARGRELANTPCSSLGGRCNKKEKKKKPLHITSEDRQAITEDLAKKSPTGFSRVRRKLGCTAERSKGIRCPGGSNTPPGEVRPLPLDDMQTGWWHVPGKRKKTTPKNVARPGARL